MATVLMKLGTGLRYVALVLATSMAAEPLRADADDSRPILNGVWAMPSQQGPHVDPKLRLPPRPAPSLRQRYRMQYEASERARKQAESRGEPLASSRSMCLPDGMPKMMSTNFPVEILETPGKVTIIAEFDTQVRHIYLEDRAHPAPDELEYNFFGHSIGRWDDGTLVVDTIGLRASTVMFDHVPHSESLQVIERFRLLGPDVLELTVTMIDPVVLEEPWTVVRLFVRQKDLRLAEYVCTENNRHWGNASGTIETELRGE